MSDVVVRGELGWERQKARNDQMRFKVLGKDNTHERRQISDNYIPNKQR
jgi:hypothetical protein